MTSVKEFRVKRPATADEPGRGAFAFTDDYSVFDWGKMPDEIPDKGASLCTMGAFNFELLADAGVPTHYEGVVPPGADDPVPLAEAEEPPREMAIALTQVPDLPFVGPDGEGSAAGGETGGDDPADAEVLNGYDYGAYHREAGGNYLVPLEVVFRNSVPVGSSLRTRAAPADVGLAADEWPDEAVDLPEPVVEFSTKYEEQDRYLGRAAADRIAGRADVDDLAALAADVNRVVTDRAAETGFVHEDGKIEVLYVDGELRVADVVGTFDENRFASDGQQVSKEVVRQHHKRTQPAWVDAVSAAKAAADERGVADWKSLCERQPEPLDADVIRVARDLYCAGTNAYTGRDWFDAPAIGDAVAAARDL
jgi:phosphoribosylaminoimidazole-succinocarboxamide synthase